MKNYLQLLLISLLLIGCKEGFISSEPQNEEIIKEVTTQSTAGAFKIDSLESSRLINLQSVGDTDGDGYVFTNLFIHPDSTFYYSNFQGTIVVNPSYVRLEGITSNIDDNGIFVSNDRAGVDEDGNDLGKFAYAQPYGSFIPSYYWDELVTFKLNPGKEYDEVCIKDIIIDDVKYKHPVCATITSREYEPTSKFSQLLYIPNETYGTTKNRTLYLRANPYKSFSHANFQGDIVYDTTDVELVSITTGIEEGIFAENINAGFDESGDKVSKFAWASAVPHTQNYKYRLVMMNFNIKNNTEVCIENFYFGDNESTPYDGNLCATLTNRE